jgi:hypothetical protein
LHQSRPEALGTAEGRLSHIDEHRTPKESLKMAIEMERREQQQAGSQSRQSSESDSMIPKVISPKLHGIIDYTHAAFFFTVGLLCRKSNKAASNAAFGTSGFILAQSLLTDYRYGAKPVISFATHGKMDTVFASTSWMMPLLFGFKGTTAAKIFEGNSFAEASVVAATDWSSERAHQERAAA